MWNPSPHLSLSPSLSLSLHISFTPFISLSLQLVRLANSSWGQGSGGVVYVRPIVTRLSLAPPIAPVALVTTEQTRTLNTAPAPVSPPVSSSSLLSPLLSSNSLL